MIRISSRDSASPSAIPSPHSTTVTASSRDGVEVEVVELVDAAEAVGVDVDQGGPADRRGVLAGDHERRRGDVAAHPEPRADALA